MSLGFIEFDGKLFFSAQGDQGYELYTTDGTTAGTQLIADIKPNGDSFPTGFTEVDGKLFFSALGEQGRELYVLESRNDDGDHSDDLLIGLYDSETDELIQVLEEGDSLLASTLDLDNLNIAATVVENGNLFGQAGSMQVLINGETSTDYFENVSSYALFGDSAWRNDYFQGSLSAGENTVTFEIYSEQMGGGELIATVERSFTIA